MAIPAITNNSPSAGSIAWAAFTIRLNNVSYAVAAGSTAQRWVWWEYKAGVPIINAGAEVPLTLSDDDLVLFANKNGIGARVQSSNFVDGELLVDGSIFADALSTNLINSQHIVTAGLDASVIKFGTMSGDRIAVNTLAGDKILANTIVASKLAITDLTDYIPDPSFERGVMGLPYTARVLATDVGVPAGAPTKYVADLPAQYDMFPDTPPILALPGDKFYVSADVVHTGAGTGALNLRVWASHDNFYPGTGWALDGPVSVPATTTAWTTVGGVLTIPQTATAGDTTKKLRYAIFGVGTGTDAGWYLTNWSVRRMNAGKLIVDGSLESRHIITAGLDAGVIKFGSMSGDRIAVNTIDSTKIVTAGLDAGVIKFGTMSGDRITVNTLTSKQILAGSILAESIDVDNLTAAIIEAGTLMSQMTITGILQIDGANMGWSAAEGLYLGSETRFYGDGRTNQIEGDLVTESLTVKDGLSIGGNADLHGTMMMANGITTPTAKMALSQTWPRITTTMGDGTGDQSNVYQGLLDLNATEWLIAFSYFGAGLRKVNKSDGTWAGDLTTGAWQSNFYPQGGICAIGASYYLLGSDSNRAGDYYLYKLDNGATVNKQAELKVSGYSAFDGHRPRIVSDGTNVGMIWTELSSSNLKLRWYKADLSASVGSDIILMGGVGKAHVGDAYYGPGQAGGTTRLWVSLQQGDSNMVRCYTTAGVSVPAEDFPRAGSSSLLGLSYDANGGSGRMYHYDKSGLMWTYSKYTTGGTLNAQYTYYDGDSAVYPAGTVINGVDKSGLVSGPHETPPSPMNSYVLSKRAWPVITAPPAPDELVTDVTQVDKANRLGIYASIGGTPALQTYLAVGERTLAQTDALSTSGAAAGASGVASFATASVPAPGRFRSSGADAAGLALVDILGSGAGRMGPSRWDAAGKPLNFGSYSTVTAQACANAAFVTRTGWVARGGTAAPPNGIAYASNGNFTIAQSGLWFLSAAVTTQGAATTNGRKITTIYVNGTTVFRAEGHNSGQAQDITPAAAGVHYLAAGDVVTVRGYQNSGASLNYTTVDEQNYFSAYCLAAF